MEMMTLEDVKAYAGSSYTVVPIGQEIFADVRTPVEVLRIVRNISSHCFILESMEDNKQWGRYTFIGYDPQMGISCKNGKAQIHAGTDITVDCPQPQQLIQQILDDNKAPKIDGMPSFTGGLVGYFAYDFIKYAEPSLKLTAKDDEGIGDIDLMLFDKVVVFDNLKQKIIIIANVRLDGVEENYNRAKLEIQRLVNLIHKGEKAPDVPLKLKSDFKTLFSKEEYCDMVEKGKHYIKEGDIFQVVLSNPIRAKAQGTLFDTFRVLRAENPSPYMFYFTSDDIEIAGASPETLVRLQDGKLSTFPLAGTRPRGADAAADKALEEDLLSDEKELAEHNMLVDLGRNDMGKISQIGTVKVEKYMEIERFSHVMHIGSTVTGKIREGKTSVDAGLSTRKTAASAFGREPVSWRIPSRKKNFRSA